MMVHMRPSCRHYTGESKQRDRAVWWAVSCFHLKLWSQVIVGTHPAWVKADCSEQKQVVG